VSQSAKDVLVLSSGNFTVTPVSPQVIDKIRMYTTKLATVTASCQSVLSSEEFAAFNHVFVAIYNQRTIEALRKGVEVLSATIKSVFQPHRDLSRMGIFLASCGIAHHDMTSLLFGAEAEVPASRHPIKIAGHDFRAPSSSLSCFEVVKSTFDATFDQFRLTTPTSDYLDPLRISSADLIRFLLSSQWWYSLAGQRLSPHRQIPLSPSLSPSANDSEDDSAMEDRPSLRVVVSPSLSETPSASSSASTSSVTSSVVSSLLETLSAMDLAAGGPRRTTSDLLQKA
jgi:hypothetical protein